jgi:hypothetical protein
MQHFLDSIKSLSAPQVSQNSFNPLMPKFLIPKFFLSELSLDEQTPKSEKKIQKNLFRVQESLLKHDPQMGPTGRKGVKTGIFFRVFLMKN